MTEQQSSQSSSHNAPLGSVGDNSCAETNFWTFDAVQERLVEAMLLWKRSPGGGRWPFAGDAPWQLMTRKTRVAIGVEGGLKGRELQLHMQAQDDEETKRSEGRERSGPLTRDEVARRDETSEWLGWVSEDSRKVVALVLAERARGRQRIDWQWIKAVAGVETGNKGAYRRYTRAISAIAQRLNSGSSKPHP